MAGAALPTSAPWQGERWASIVAEAEATGARHADIALKYRVSLSALKYHVYKARRGERTVVPRLAGNMGDSDSPTPVPLRASCMRSDRAQRSRDVTSRMREIRRSGSVGAPEERSSGATRLLTWPSLRSGPCSRTPGVLPTAKNSELERCDIRQTMVTGEPFTLTTFSGNWARSPDRYWGRTSALTRRRLLLEEALEWQMRRSR
jgi:hypothetical protein